MADAGPGLFGTGAGSFRTRQELQMISGLPPLVREKDRFTALFTLRNGTAKAMVVNVAARPAGAAWNPGSRPSTPKALKWRGPSRRRRTKPPWPGNSKPATANGSARDRLRIAQQVAPPCR